MEFLKALFQYQFLQHALYTSVMVGVFSGVIGCFIVLRGMALMGDAISHAVLPGVAIAYGFGFNLFYGAVATGLLTALGIGFVQQNSRVKSDSAIGIVFSAAFALGVILIAKAQSARNLNNILFGNVLTVKASDMWTTLGVGAFVLLCVYLFYKELLISSFDPTMAAVYGLPVRFIHYGLMTLLTLVTVASLQTVGVVLVVAMLVTPASTAYLLTNRLSTMLFLSAAFGVVAAVAGLYFSYVYNLTSGAVIVLAAAVLFLLALLLSPKQGLLWRTRRRSRGAAAAALVLMLVFGGLRGSAGAAPSEGKLPVVATFSVIYDIVKTVGGDRVDVHSMVPLGQDPHEYTPLPLDVRKATDAAAIFWNGLEMELGDGWFESLLEVAGKQLDGEQVVALAEGVEPMYLVDGDESEVNPHAFLSVPIAMHYVENARDGLSRVDPDYAELYARNAADYLAQLEELHEQYVELFGRIPEERRILVTSERAFQYMAAEYGLKEGYVWAIDTDEQGTPRQIVDLVQFVRRSGVTAMFVESNVDPRALETVSRETGVPIVGTVYSDELGKPGEEGGTLLGMLKWNLKTIYAGLMGN